MAHVQKVFTSLPKPPTLQTRMACSYRNWSLCFRELPSTLRNSIVKDHSFPFVGKTLFKGMLCYPSSYVISRESFICRAFAQSFVFFFMQMALPLFLRIQLKNDRMLSPMKRNKAQTTHVFGFASWKLAIFLAFVIWGLQSEPLRDLFYSYWRLTGMDEEYRMIKGITYVSFCQE